MLDIPFSWTCLTGILSLINSNIKWHCNFNDVWYRIKCLPFIYSFHVDYVKESLSSVIIIVWSQHLCWLHAGITVVCHSHCFIWSPNSKVGSFEIAKIKIAKIILHTLTLKLQKFPSTKISRYTVFTFQFFYLHQGEGIKGSILEQIKSMNQPLVNTHRLIVGVDGVKLVSIGRIHKLIINEELMWEWYIHVVHSHVYLQSNPIHVHIYMYQTRWVCESQIPLAAQRTIEKSLYTGTMEDLILKQKSLATQNLVGFLFIIKIWVLRMD